MKITAAGRFLPPGSNTELLLKQQASYRSGGRSHIKVWTALPKTQQVLLIFFSFTALFGSKENSAQTVDNFVQSRYEKKRKCGHCLKNYSHLT